MLVSTLGYPIFDEVAKSGEQKRKLLYCKGKDAEATGEYTEDGLVVLSGSICRNELVKSAGTWVAAHRSRLLEQSILLEEGKGLRFVEDFAFPSPSAAAAVVLGRPANGWIEWKYESGKTLDEVKR